ncbi:hypothetical protein GN956_G20918 [Arapaima gigas]
MCVSPSTLQAAALDLTPTISKLSSFFFFSTPHLRGQCEQVEEAGVTSRNRKRTLSHVAPNKHLLSDVYSKLFVIHSLR